MMGHGQSKHVGEFRASSCLASWSTNTETDTKWLHNSLHLEEHLLLDEAATAAVNYDYKGEELE